jgi:hypothetical protein
MTTLHPVDNDIQEYSLNNIIDAAAMNHIQQCKQCSSKAAQYKKMFEGITKQSKPTFNFNITQLVMEQLPAAKEKFTIEKYFISIAVLLMIALLIYPARIYLSKTAISLTPIIVSLITTSVLVISIFLIADMYKKFKAKMDVLNYY